MAEALEVDLEWLLNGNESKKGFPADKKLIDWLREHSERRREIWEEMKKEED